MVHWASGWVCIYLALTGMINRFVLNDFRYRSCALRVPDFVDQFPEPGERSLRAARVLDRNLTDS